MTKTKKIENKSLKLMKLKDKKLLILMRNPNIKSILKKKNKKMLITNKKNLIEHPNSQVLKQIKNLS